MFLRQISEFPYTSQMDSMTDRLEGRRVGDKFYHMNGDVSQADTNAAVNVKQRADDTEISHWAIIIVNYRREVALKAPFNKSLVVAQR